jgi:hypothetical protein
MQGIEICHGTSAESVEEIRRAGLHPPEFPADPATRWTLTSSGAEARGIAERYMQFGGDGAVITYRVAGDEIDAYLYEPIDLGTVKWYALRRPLPGSMICHVEHLPAEPDQGLMVRLSESAVGLRRPVLAGHGDLLELAGRGQPRTKQLPCDIRADYPVGPRPAPLRTAGRIAIAPRLR